MPLIGDADGGWLLPLTPRAADDLRGVMAVAAAFFARSDYAWAADGPAPDVSWILGAAGQTAFAALTPQPPRTTPSRLFPDGGYAIMQTGWERDADQLVFDGGPLGSAISGAHGHADLLSLQCTAFGEPFLVDPGTDGYTLHPAWRDFFRGTAAHSTVWVDDQPHATPAGPFKWIAQPRAHLRHRGAPAAACDRPPPPRGQSSGVPAAGVAACHRWRRTGWCGVRRLRRGPDRTGQRRLSPTRGCPEERGAQPMIWRTLFWTGLGFVVVSYLGYPLWVACLARLRSVPTKARYLPDPLLPSVTCVMAAANEAALIGRKLDILVHQDYPQEKLSIIVVSDASTDDTDRIVRERAAGDPRIRLLRTSRRSGKPTAINLARRHIDTPITILVDARPELTPGAIRELVAHLADPHVGVVSGDLRVTGDVYWTYEGFIWKSESRSGSMVQTTGSLYAVRTADLPEIPPDTIMDDVYVPQTIAQSGRRIVMAEKAGSLDVATRSVRSEFIRTVRTMAGLVQICHTLRGCLNPARNPLWGRFIVHKVFRLACPYGFLLMLVSSALAEGPGYRIALAAMVGVGLIALGGWLGARSRLSSLILSFVALHLAALWAVPYYYLGRLSVTWARVETDRT